MKRASSGSVEAVRAMDAADASGKGEELRRSEEGLLINSKTTNTAGNQQKYGVAEFPPPSYVGGAYSEVRASERRWDEPLADFAQRRMDQQRAQMLENLKKGGFEQRRT